ncbi:checkpoint protein Hus1/Mec3 [Leucosporidium creatinivorum]|uniref:Checkpoint protein n=1 Tax=Leucosporidium creatinivorum TaxID=106004 RepID=A0A1Y2DWJ0_9BASI|nr:checkpoint protein Hus1/Mec3 [Leucosporidium creatinivorum]
MRFRAEITNPSSFSRLIGSLTPLSKLATLKLKPDTVHLVCLSDGSAGCVQVWSQIAVSSIFDVESFRLESNNNNEIYLEISTDALSRALKSAGGATQVIIKLAKKGGLGPQGTGKGAHPVLTLAITSASRAGRSLEITQDVGVKVKKQAEVDAMKEPLCPTPDVNILLPPLSTLRTVCDRLKTISSTITISANRRGEFRLRAESDEANVETEWRGLKHPEAGPDDEPPSQPLPSPSTFHSVTVDAKNLLKFLASYSIASTTIACVCADHCAIFYVYIGDAKDNLQGGVLTFFVPAVSRDGDDD